MFFFFPLPAGVLMYMLIANIFQTAQTFILMREPLPENIQKMMDQQEKEVKSGEKRDALPFEPKRSKKAETPEKEAKSGEKKETMPFEPKRSKKKASS
jgi:YidC/Oxa1 family membrane protein insertase